MGLAVCPKSASLPNLPIRPYEMAPWPVSGSEEVLPSTSRKLDLMSLLRTPREASRETSLGELVSASPSPTLPCWCFAMPRGSAIVGGSSFQLHPLFLELHGSKWAGADE